MPLDAEVGKRSLHDPDATLGVAHPQAAAPVIDGNVVGDIAVEIALGNRAVEGETIVEPQRPAAPIVDAALVAPGRPHALVVAEQLQRVGRDLGHRKLHIGQAEAAARLQQRPHLRIIGAIEPGDIARQLGHIQHLAGRLVDALEDITGIGLHIARDRHLLKLAFGQLDLDGAVGHLLGRQGGDAGRNPLAGVQIVDGGEQLLQVREIDLPPDIVGTDLVQLLGRQEFGAVELELLQRKLRSAGLQQIALRPSRSDHGRPLLLRPLLLALQLLQLAA